MTVLFQITGAILLSVIIIHAVIRTRQKGWLWPVLWGLTRLFQAYLLVTPVAFIMLFFGNQEPFGLNGGFVFLCSLLYLPTLWWINHVSPDKKPDTTESEKAA